MVSSKQVNWEVLRLSATALLPRACVCDSNGNVVQLQLSLTSSLPTKTGERKRFDSIINRLKMRTVRRFVGEKERAKNREVDRYRGLEEMEEEWHHTEWWRGIGIHSTLSRKQNRENY